MKSNAPDKSVLLQVIHDGLGAADQSLQHSLMRKYLLLLQENKTLPGAIAFYTSGVNMVVEGSPVLDVFLQSFEAQGVRLIVCKTCLDYYGLPREGSGRDRGRHGRHHRSPVAGRQNYYALNCRSPGSPQGQRISPGVENTQSEILRCVQNDSLESFSATC